MRKFCGGETLFDMELLDLQPTTLLLIVFSEKGSIWKKYLSDEEAQHKLSWIKIEQEVEKLMFDHPYWDKLVKVDSLYEPLYMVLRLVDSKVVHTIRFV